MDCVPRKFALISQVTHIEVIARGVGVDVRHHLDDEYPSGSPHRWRKLKGKAWVQYSDGSVVYAEIHWFEAEGVGRVKVKIARELNADE